MEKVYFNDEYYGTTLYYKIPGTLIDSNDVYYKNAAGNLFNHNTYENDPDLESTDYYDNPYTSYFEGLLYEAYEADPKQPFLFTSDGTPLVDPLYTYSSVYTFSNGELKLGGSYRDVITTIMTDGKFTILDSSYLAGNDVYNEYSNAGMEISGDSTTGSKLLSRNPNTYSIITLNGLGNFTYYTTIDALVRRGGTSESMYTEGYFTNGAFLTNSVDTRATCFEPILNRLRSSYFSSYALDGTSETYSPYILNRIGRCVTITHAPDVTMYSIINFGDGTAPVAIFTDPAGTHVGGGDIYTDCWSGTYNELNSSDYPPQVKPTIRPNWGYYSEQSDTYSNEDPYLARMRDYRATHTYASNGTYTITIESYSVFDSTGSDSGTDVTHTTTTYSLTVTDADSQDIIYFKVPKEFDHIYINGVRCPVVEKANDYNVVGLDVTGYNWFLGKICAGRRDVVLCKLPLLADTNYVKYQCRLVLSRSGDKRDYETSEYIGSTATETYDHTFDMVYDSRTQLYYVDDLATKTGVPDINCLRAELYNDDGNVDIHIHYFCDFTITITGIQQDNSSTTLITYNSEEFPDGRILTPDYSYGIDVLDAYHGWQPFFARSSIQVAEFENDYVRSTMDDLGFIRGSRDEYNVHFLSDYSNMIEIASVFGDDILTPLTSYRSPTYCRDCLECSWYSDYQGYNSAYSTGSSINVNSIAILTEACIGKTYDLRNAVPWKTFFPGCYCNNAPLTIYN